MSSSLKVGDQVLWRDRWGAAPPKKVTIKTIEVCVEEDNKHGTEVPAVDWDFADGRYIIVDFEENDHWSWGYQINKLNDHWEGYEN
jgi:hypothetical protein